jgi:hypothetical protein
MLKIVLLLRKETAWMQVCDAFYTCSKRRIESKCCYWKLRLQ